MKTESTADYWLVLKLDNLKETDFTISTLKEEGRCQGELWEDENDNIFCAESMI